MSCQKCLTVDNCCIEVFVHSSFDTIISSSVPDENRCYLYIFRWWLSLIFYHNMQTSTSLWQLCNVTPQSARRLKASLQNSLTFPAEIPIWSGSLMSADESLWDGFIFLRWKLSIDLPCFITKHPEQAEHRDKCKYSNQIGSISPNWPTARQRGKVLHVTNRSKYGVLSRDGNAWVLGSLVLRGFLLQSATPSLFLCLLSRRSGAYCFCPPLWIF